MTFYIKKFTPYTAEHDGKMHHIETQTQERDFMARHDVIRTDNREISQHNEHLRKSREEQTSSLVKKTIEGISERIIYESQRDS